MEEDILQQLGQGEPTEETPEVKPEEKKKSSGKPLDDEVIASMMANGDNTRGMFEPDESEVIDKDKKEKKHEDQDDSAKLKTRGDAKPSDKYKDKFKEDMMKNPEKYFIDTPKGRMSIKEAKEQGYDPVTKRFKNRANNQREAMLSQVNDKDQEAIRKLMDPSQLGLAPADAEGLGIKPNSPMVKQANPLAQPAQAPTPMSPPTAGPAPAQGAPDINALLGGM